MNNLTNVAINLKKELLEQEIKTYEGQLEAYSCEKKIYKDKLAQSLRQCLRCGVMIKTLNDALFEHNQTFEQDDCKKMGDMINRMTNLLKESNEKDTNK